MWSEARRLQASDLRSLAADAAAVSFARRWATPLQGCVPWLGDLFLTSSAGASSLAMVVSSRLAALCGELRILVAFVSFARRVASPAASADGGCVANPGFLMATRRHA